MIPSSNPRRTTNLAAADVPALSIKKWLWTEKALRRTGEDCGESTAKRSRLTRSGELVSRSIRPEHGKYQFLYEGHHVRNRWDLVRRSESDLGTKPAGLCQAIPTYRRTSTLLVSGSPGTSPCRQHSQVDSFRVADQPECNLVRPRIKFGKSDRVQSRCHSGRRV